MERELGGGRESWPVWLEGRALFWAGTRQETLVTSGGLAACLRGCWEDESFSLASRGWLVSSRHFISSSYICEVSVTSGSLKAVGQAQSESSPKERWMSGKAWPSLRVGNREEHLESLGQKAEQDSLGEGWKM